MRGGSGVTTGPVITAPVCALKTDPWHGQMSCPPWYPTVQPAWVRGAVRDQLPVGLADDYVRLAIAGICVSGSLPGGQLAACAQLDGFGGQACRRAGRGRRAGCRAGLCRCCVPGRTAATQTRTRCRSPGSRVGVPAVGQEEQEVEPQSDCGGRSAEDPGRDEHSHRDLDERDAHPGGARVRNGERPQQKAARGPVERLLELLGSLR